MQNSRETVQGGRLVPQPNMDPDRMLTRDLLGMSRQELQTFLQQEAGCNPLLQLVDKCRQPDCGEVMNGTASLERFLEIQLEQMVLSPEVRQACQRLTGALNSRGYLPRSPVELARSWKMEPETVKEAVEVLKSLEPAGVGARDLQECLLLQAQRYCPEDRLLETIIREHLELGLEHRVSTLAHEMEINVSDIWGSLLVLRTLSLRPAYAFAGSRCSRKPEGDVLVKQVGGRLQVLINEARVPIPVMSDDYRMLLEIGDEDPELRRTLNRRLKRTLSIIRSYEKRNETLRRITEVLVKEQPYLTHPKARKRPVTMTRVARLLGCSVSTVSRAVRHKYLETPVGIFSFKKIFSHSSASGQGSPGIRRS